MTLPEQLGTLESSPALDHPDLLGPTVAEALAAWPGASEVAVVAIDPEFADTAAMSQAYDLPLTTGELRRRRGQARGRATRWPRAWSSRTTRPTSTTWSGADLDVRKARFAADGPRGRRVGHGVRRDHTGRVPRRVAGSCVDARVLEMDVAVAIIGCGVRSSKLRVPGACSRPCPAPR